MANITRATSFPDGIALGDDVVGIFYGSGDPSTGAGEVAPIGSLYLRTNGSTYVKTSAPAVGWSQLSFGGTGSIDNLSDVDTSTVPPLNGDSLVWSTSLNNWVPSSVAQSGGNYGNNYIFAYDNTTQIIATPNVWQNVTFSTNVYLSDWVHTANTAEFVCATSSLYIVTYEFNTEKNGGGQIEVATRATVNNVEVQMSHNGMDISSNNTAFSVSRTFPCLINAGQTLRMQFVSTTTNARITPAPTPAPAATYPVSGTMTIRRMT